MFRSGVGARNWADTYTLQEEVLLWRLRTGRINNCLVSSWRQLMALQAASQQLSGAIARWNGPRPYIFWAAVKSSSKRWIAQKAEKHAFFRLKRGMVAKTGACRYRARIPAQRLLALSSVSAAPHLRLWTAHFPDAWCKSWTVKEANTAFELSPDRW